VNFFRLIADGGRFRFFVARSGTGAAVDAVFTDLSWSVTIKTKQQKNIAGICRGIGWSVIIDRLYRGVG